MDENTITKPANVLMLPAKKATNIGICIKDMSDRKIGDIEYFSSSMFVDLRYWKPQYLYFTTDDTIEETDWYIDDTNTIRESVTSDGDCWERRSDYKKIVATTNPDLWYKGPFNEALQRKTYGDLPRIDTTFVEAYVREQGKIDKVMLEYEQTPLKITDCVKCNGSGIYDEGDCMISKCRSCYSELSLTQREDAQYNHISLKLKSNGSVIVHPVKCRMYTKEDLELAFAQGILAQKYIKELPTPRIRFKNWFEQNYTQ